MKVCLFATSFLPDSGGSQVVIHQLATCLVKLGHEPIVLVRFPRKYPRCQFDYPVHRIVPGVLGSYSISPWLHDFALLAQLLAERIRAPFDLLHAHNAYPAGHAGALLSRLIRVPMVITCHGADIQILPAIGCGMRLNHTTAARIGRAIQQADAIVGITDAARKEILALGGDPARIYAVPNGVDNSRFTATKGDVREMFGFPDDSKVILSVGLFATYLPMKRPTWHMATLVASTRTLNRLGS